MRPTSLLACLRLIALRGQLESGACNSSDLPAGGKIMNAVVSCKECSYCPNRCLYCSKNENNIFGWANNAQYLGVGSERAPASMMLKHIIFKARVTIYPRVCCVILQDKKRALVAVAAKGIRQLCSSSYSCIPERWSSNILRAMFCE